MGIEINKITMRKFLIKILKMIPSGLRLRTISHSAAYAQQISEESAVYRLPYKPGNEKIIASLLSRGWQITLEVNTNGELEYSINLEKTTAIVADRK